MAKKKEAMTKYYIFMFLAAMCIGTIGVFVKLIGSALPAMSLNFLRIFIAMLFLFVTIPFLDKKWYKVDKQTLKEYAFIGFLYALALSLFNMANLHAPVQNVVLIFSSFPFFVLIFAYFMLGEKITSTKLGLLAIAFVALAIINPFNSGASLLGNIFAVANAIVFAFLVVQMRMQNKKHNIGDVLWFMIFASVFLLPFPFIYGLGEIVSILPYLLVLGIVSTGLAYLFYNLALERLEAEVSSIIVILVNPLIAITLAYVILGEMLSVRLIVGGSILLAASLYLALHTKNIEKE